MFFYINHMVNLHVAPLYPTTTLFPSPSSLISGVFFIDMLLFAAIILAVCLVAGFMPKHGMQTIIYLGWAILAASVLLTAIRYLVF